MNQIMLMLGLNASGFFGGLKKASDEAKAFGRDWTGLKKVFAAGGMVTTFAYFFSSIIKGAQETKAELEKMGEPIPNHIRSVAEFGDALDNVLKVARTAATYVVSGWTQIGEQIGYAINRARGYSEAQQNIIVATEKEAVAAEKRLAEARAANSPEKIAAAEEKLGKIRRDIAYEQANTSGKLNILLKEYVGLAQKVSVFEEHSVKGAEARAELARNLNEQRKLGIALEKESADADQAAATAAKAVVEAKAAAEAKQRAAEKLAEEGRIAAANEMVRLAEERAREEEKVAKVLEGHAEAARRTQQAYEAVMFGITNGGHSSEQIQEADPAALRELLSRNNNQLEGLRTNPGSAFDYGNSLTITRLENENRRIQRELDQRDSISRDVAFFGKEGARRQYGGDPLLFDRLVDRFTREQDRTDRQLSLMEKLLARIGPDAEGNLPAAVESLSQKLERGISSIAENLKPNR